MRDTDMLQDKIDMAFVGTGAVYVYESLMRGEVTKAQFMNWIIDERYQSNQRGYEEGYQDGKHYES